MEKKAKISIDQNRNLINGFGELGILNIAKHHEHFTDFNKLFTQCQGGWEGKILFRSQKCELFSHYFSPYLRGETLSLMLMRGTVTNYSNYFINNPHDFNIVTFLILLH